MDAKEIKSARFQIAYWRDYAKYCDSKVAHAVRVLFPVGVRVKCESAKIKGVVVGHVEDHQNGELLVKVKTEFYGATCPFPAEELKLEGEE